MNNEKSTVNDVKSYKVKGYKVFDSNWTCLGFQYKVGETYKHEGEIKLCHSGYHFCQKAVDCFSFYTFNPENKVAEVEALGVVKTDGVKSVTDHIRIVREISWEEVLRIVNYGYGNSGYGNSGDHNSGNGNPGNANTGNVNVGNYNSGNRNRGNRNTGDYNVGNRNVGDYNIGDDNVGDWNSGNGNTGFFNTESPRVYSFNKPTDYTIEEFRRIEGVRLLDDGCVNCVWIYATNMTDSEKMEHPEYSILNGYSKMILLKDACAKMWEKFSEEEKEEVKRIPNFDPDIFEEITGIRV